MAIEIRKRLAVILMNLPHRQIKKQDKKPNTPRATIDDLLSKTSHAIVSKGTRFHCTECLSNSVLMTPRANIG